MRLSRRQLTLSLATTVAGLASPHVWAQSGFPSKPIKIVVPFPAGGTTDIVARLMAPKLTDVWGQQVRIRLSNAFGTKPVTFDDVHVGLQESGSAVVAGTNHPLQFKGAKSVTVPPGGSVPPTSHPRGWANR